MLRIRFYEILYSLLGKYNINEDKGVIHENTRKIKVNK